ACLCASSEYCGWFEAHRRIGKASATPEKSGSAYSTRQLRRWKTGLLGVKGLETSASTGMPPSPFHHATRTPLKSRSSGARKRAPSSWSARGLLASGPAMALRKSATSATVRAMGPETDSGDHEPDSA